MPVVETVLVAAVAAMAPYLRVVGERIAEGAGQAASGGIVSLIGSVRRKLSKDSRGSEVLDDLAQRPQDEALRRELVDLLLAKAEDDPAFAAELERLAPAAAGETSMRVDVSDQAQVGKVVQVRDVQGDLNF